MPEKSGIPSWKEKFFSLYVKGLTDAEIAKELYISRPSVSRWRRQLGYKANFQQGDNWLDREEDEKRHALYDQGLSDAKIAQAVGVTRDTIRAWRKHRDLPANKRVGQHSPLSTEEEEKRRRLVRRGYTDEQIARLSGVTQPAITEWRNRRGLKRGTGPGPRPLHDFRPRR